MAFLKAIVGWIESDDMTYYYSGVGLWGVAELTCGILVFTVPLTPKAFRDMQLSKWIARLTSSVNPSKRQLRRPAHIKISNWPRSAIRSPNPREYAEIDELGTIRAPTMTSPRPTDLQYGIVCTTDIIVTESFESDIAEYGTRYPWNSSD